MLPREDASELVVSANQVGHPTGESALCVGYSPVPWPYDSPELLRMSAPQFLGQAARHTEPGTRGNVLSKVYGV